ncbi:probable receptor-like serine/threonine-protein kinase At5g57670 isoform X2 [Prosopis cineraria]|uniref:probable receptor-like serine/threonine-protein kinase At5g57670 isoform X2 n=1 Tax=Prosopis cineraria TaxID=364024 RepID=UPI002410162F|nr:probable receptor-like serine/threonine-protein kinase At5g57670 isoform X2 [Prosopis cineraria]
MVLASSPSKILIGLSLDRDDSRELLSWAVRVLANPNDTIVALHVLVSKDKKKRKKKRASMTRRQSQLRQAKACVISVLGEFAKACWSKQVNLEAKVAFSSNVGEGLVEEAKSISAEFLLLRGSRNQSSKNQACNGITKYCFQNVHESCTIVSVGKSSKASFTSPEDNYESSSGWFKEDKQSDRRESPVLNAFISDSRTQTRSPRTVLDAFEGQSNSTEDDTFSTRVSSITDTPSMASKMKSKSNFRKPQSPFRLIASLLASPLRRKNSKKSQNEKRQPLLKCFSYEEISTATNGFHQDNLVGRGGYSEVYRGDLSDGQSIAVKRLSKDKKDANKEKEFLMELGVIGHVCHPNTTSLVGCCIENGLYLVFKYSQNGNLATALHGKSGTSLDWAVRYKVAIGVARGLHYLHKCCKRRIIHRDIKASNVLLGPDYEPQITDFGLAKWLPNKWTHHAVIPVEGTFGYLAPESFMHGIVDEKTDVFAFGILLLEIVTGRRPVDSKKQNLLLWAKPLMESGNIRELADPRMEGAYDEEELNRVVLTASYCVRQSPLWRPQMSEVLELLSSGEDSEAGKSWRIPKLTTSESDELDDYSMAFGYEVPSDIYLEEFL